LIKDFLEAFLQFGRPALLHRKEAGSKELFDPLSLWIGASGGAMELNYITKEVRRLSQEFNPYLDITPYSSRRSAPTNVFAQRVPLEGARLEDFTKAMSLLMNVSETVLVERYNRHKALNQNAETQRILLSPTKEQVQGDLNKAQTSMARLLKGKTIIPSFESSKVTRPVRLQLDKKEWLKEKRAQEKELKIAKEKRKEMRQFMPDLDKWRTKYEDSENEEEEEEEEKEEEKEEADEEMAEADSQDTWRCEEGVSDYPDGISAVSEPENEEDEVDPLLM
jgi:hypothetical protein